MAGVDHDMDTPVDLPWSFKPANASRTRETMPPPRTSSSTTSTCGRTAAKLLSRSCLPWEGRRAARTTTTTLTWSIATSARITTHDLDMIKRCIRAAGLGRTPGGCDVFLHGAEMFRSGNVVCFSELEFCVALVTFGGGDRELERRRGGGGSRAGTVLTGAWVTATAGWT